MFLLGVLVGLIYGLLSLWLYIGGNYEKETYIIARSMGYL